MTSNYIPALPTLAPGVPGPEFMIDTSQITRIHSPSGSVDPSFEDLTGSRSTPPVQLRIASPIIFQHINTPVFQDPALENLKLKTTKPDGKFLIKNQRLFLTYATHLDKQDFSSWINTKVGSCKFIRLAHETGYSNGSTEPYPHTHVMVDFVKVLNNTNPRVLDYNGIHPNIRAVQNVRHWTNLLQYIAKQDPQNADLKPIVLNDQPEEEKIPLCDRVWSCSSLEDAIRNLVHRPSDYSGICSIWRAKPLPRKDINHVTWLDWQQGLANYLDNTEGDGRKILWITDLPGGSGKSTFTRTLEDCNHTRYANLQGLTSCYHGAPIIQSFLDKGWSGNTLLLDLTRQAEDPSGMYDALEAIANGRIATVKYSGQMLRFDSKRICVFANWYPDLDRFTHNRWDLYKIHGDMGCVDRKLLPISIDDIQRARGLRSAAPDVRETTRNLPNRPDIPKEYPPNEPTYTAFTAPGRF